MEDVTDRYLIDYRAQGYFRQALNHENPEVMVAAMVIFVSLSLLEWWGVGMTDEEKILLQMFRVNWWDESSLLGARFVRARILTSSYPAVIIAREVLFCVLRRCEPLPLQSRKLPRWYTVVYNYIINKL